MEKWGRALRGSFGHPRQSARFGGGAGGPQEGGVAEVLVLGDTLGYSPHPHQVLKRLRREGLSPILGAWDLRVPFPKFPVPEGVGKETLAFTQSQLKDEDPRFLQSLRMSHRSTYEGVLTAGRETRKISRSSNPKTPSSPSLGSTGPRRFSWAGGTSP